MPKKKKTRKLKIRSDMRRQVNLPRQEISVSENNSYVLEQNKTANTPVIKQQTVLKQQPVIAHAISTNDYRYLSTDLFKTAIVTGIIILIELLLNYITKGFS